MSREISNFLASRRIELLLRENWRLKMRIKELEDKIKEQERFYENYQT